jgi:GT2 family glycosyltransferase
MAYNAVRALPRQMEALLAQTLPLKEIIIVDNASTDGTSAMLAERYPQVTVLRMTENLGAAGAWAAGLSYAALEKGYDWVWTFDDDSLPAAEALEILLQGVEKLGAAKAEIGMLATLPVDRATGRNYPPVLWRDGFVKGSTELLQQPVWLADLVIASGCMVRRGMVEKIGLPRADFFMDVFDLEYCIRARSQGYKIAVVTDAKLMHEIGDTRKINLPGYKRLWMNQPPWREYYISRNLTYLAWWLRPNSAVKHSIARYLLIHAVQVLLFSTKKLPCLMRMVQGFRDGLRGRLGIRLTPEVNGLQGPSGALSAGEHAEVGKA